MDQLKAFLRQCVKQRFWISIGVSILLVLIASFAFSNPIIQATTKAEGDIKAADTEVKKYTSPGLPNAQYDDIVKEKTAVLTKDVDATWQKLFAQQEPLLRWPEVVESRFRKWGRKWPENVDAGAVTTALVDYTIAYPDFVTRVYKTFDPFNPEDGKGLVAAPDEQVLIRPAPFEAATPPELGKVWAEQERLWVVSALLDVVRKVNSGAKDWEGTVVKQINGIEVGTALAQDQVSIAKGEVLEPAKDLLPDGQEAPAADASADPGMMGMMGPMGGGSGGSANAGVVLYIKTDSTQYTLLPIMMNVLVDQNRLQDFLIGLENSPIAIQVMEPEISKPAKPVEKPTYGMSMNFGYGGMGSGMMGMGMMPGMEGGMSSSMMGRGMGMNMGSGMGMGMGRGMGSADMMMGGMGGMGGNSAPKAGKSIREVDKKKEREKLAEKAKAKPAVKSKSLDPYYNVIEVTVYGQARFYNAPPPPDPNATPASPGAETPTAPAATDGTPTATPAPAPAPAAAPAPGTEAPATKAEAPATQAETPATKAETPAATPAPESATPKS